MCGFIASVGINPDPSLFQSALDCLRHRGPDAGGHWCDQEQRVWLGHRRLAIVDLSSDGNQPLTNENKSLQLVCNGEIYNAPALRQQLVAMGHCFRSRSDNEVILHAYEAWGEGCLDHLQGMFAFALWDGEQKYLWLVRDPMGMKPLYYAQWAGGVVAASEAAALLPLLPESPRPDALALCYLLTLGYIPAPHAVWQGVAKLPAGHALHWQQGEGRLRRYWQPPREAEPGSTLSPERWQALFGQVVQDHLMADVPISLFLSAGLDSTAVAVALAKQGRGAPSFTVAFVNSPRNEGPMAREIAQQLGFSHHEIALGVADMAALTRQAGHLDEPLATSGYPLYLAICQRAALQGKVALGGDGGDETMGGYTWYRNLWPLPTGGGQRVRATLAAVIKRPAPPFMRRLAARSFAASSVLHRHAWRIFPRFLPEEIEFLLSPMAVNFDDEAMLAPLTCHFEPGLALPRALQRVDLLSYSSDYNNTKVDRASMAHGLEVRLPFLDRRMVEAHLRLPWTAEEESAGKPWVRRFLQGNVPDALFKRPKQGFSMRGEPPDWEVLITQIEQGYWVRQGLWHRHWKNLLLPGVPYREGRIWALTMLTHWGNWWLGKGNL